jgi:hypothetical protein
MTTFRARLAMALTLALPFRASAVIVDRIAITAGDRVIADSEIEQRIRLTAFQNHESADIGIPVRQRAARELLDQKLIEREMDVGRYPRLATDRRKALLADYAKENYKGDPDAMAAALKAYRLTPRDLEDDLARESDLLTFLNLRFRPAVQVNDQDVQKYAAENGLLDALNDVRAEIEEKLTTERADKELDLWLQDQRKRTKIEYLEKDLAAVGGK